MELRDYLKRQIEQMAQVLGTMLANLIGLKNQGMVGEGIEVTEQALKEELDLDIESLISIQEEKLVETLTIRNSFQGELLEKLADLLFELAGGLDQLDDTEKARAIYRKALAIYEYVDSAGSTFSFDRHHKMESARKRIL